jgi:hypothetical protein
MLPWLPFPESTAKRKKKGGEKRKRSQAVFQDKNLKYTLMFWKKKIPGEENYFHNQSLIH